MRSIFIFRRDLRLQDNTALIDALRNSESVLACFILDPRQAKDNGYFSKNAFQFMVQSLKELDQELRKKGGRLHVFEGIAEEVVEDLISNGFGDVYVNRDYTPFSVERDRKIKKVCESKGKMMHVSSDILLHEPEECMKADGNPYTVFTPYYNNAKSMKVRKPDGRMRGRFCDVKIGEIGPDDIGYERNEHLFAEPGRKAGLRILDSIKEIHDYKERQEIPSLDTTGLSAHNKFGTVSIREVHQKISDTLGDESLIRQLYWRDFFTHIAYNFPHVFGGAFRKKYDQISWSQDKQAFRRWCEGKSGFPIVDAGMRQLNSTGWMHNRVRMIAASFLVKDLHIDWRWGERYFAQKLVDYDPSVNNGSWQWAASTGCDAQPYFRIFNPWRQQKRFDPDCDYIRTWVEELQEADTKEIHDTDKRIDGYPEPMVDHKEESKKAKAAFKGL